MDIAIKDILETYGTSAIARAMGLPISTVHSWKRANAIPGADAPEGSRGLYDMRVQALKAAVKALQKKRAA
jgi:uncharacterized protein YjcR